MKNKANGAALPGAIVKFDRAPPVATQQRRPLHLARSGAPARSTVTVEKDGFQSGSANLDVTVGETAELDVELVPLVKEGMLKGPKSSTRRISRSPTSRSTLDGPTKQTLTTDAEGQFEGVAREGKYSITVEEEGFLRKSRTHELKGGETYTADFLIRKPPKESAGGEIRGNRILVKEVGPLHHRRGPSSRRTPLRCSTTSSMSWWTSRRSAFGSKAHTDNVGNDDSNMKLSKDRAQSVVQYLVDQGHRLRAASPSEGSDPAGRSRRI